MFEFRIPATMMICTIVLMGGCRISHDIQEVEPPSDQPPLTELRAGSLGGEPVSSDSNHIIFTRAGDSQ
ncbi:MAG: hypothetical protein ACOCR1_01655 [Planctomycetota bacterium]